MNGPPGPAVPANPVPGGNLPCLSCGHWLGPADPGRLPARCPECGAAVHGDEPGRGRIEAHPLVRLRQARDGARLVAAGVALALAVSMLWSMGPRLAITPIAAAWASQAWSAAELASSLALAVGHWWLAGLACDPADAADAIPGRGRRGPRGRLGPRALRWAAAFWLVPWTLRGFSILAPVPATFIVLSFLPVLAGVALALVAWRALRHDPGPGRTLAVLAAATLPVTDLSSWLVGMVMVFGGGATAPRLGLGVTLMHAASRIIVIVVAFGAARRLAVATRRRAPWEPFAVASRSAGGSARIDPVDLLVMTVAAFASIALATHAVGHHAYGPLGRSYGAIVVAAVAAAIGAAAEIALLRALGASARARRIAAAGWTCTLVPVAAAVLDPLRTAPVAATIALGPAIAFGVLALGMRRWRPPADRTASHRERTVIDLVLAAIVVVPLALLADAVLGLGVADLLEARRRLDGTDLVAVHLAAASGALVVGAAAALGWIGRADGGRSGGRTGIPSASEG